MFQDELMQANLRRIMRAWHSVATASATLKVVYQMFVESADRRRCQWIMEELKGRLKIGRLVPMEKRFTKQRSTETTKQLFLAWRDSSQSLRVLRQLKDVLLKKSWHTWSKQLELSRRDHTAQKFYEKRLKERTMYFWLKGYREKFNIIEWNRHYDSSKLTADSLAKICLAKMRINVRWNKHVQLLASTYDVLRVERNFFQRLQKDSRKIRHVRALEVEFQFRLDKAYLDNAWRLWIWQMTYQHRQEKQAVILYRKSKIRRLFSAWQYKWAVCSAHVERAVKLHERRVLSRGLTKWKGITQTRWEMTDLARKFDEQRELGGTFGIRIALEGNVMVTLGRSMDLDYLKRDGKMAMVAWRIWRHRMELKRKYNEVANELYRLCLLKAVLERWRKVLESESLMAELEERTMRTKFEGLQLPKLEGFDFDFDF
ncbi:hypothetical protein BC938DRAFT_476581 [Jimgerdemannia flammicorona]|uniref:Sfi1 spindle body protein-domain-containing protein n=1 Tax=Jimgerdemannia flammicorona TaxID=994334 RepID=A0A433QQE8_9FUNG|nr:hypothetical protein BC938DRAFT_476581 [Jimgerdemannia flammicorona]